VEDAIATEHANRRTDFILHPLEAIDLVRCSALFIIDWKELVLQN
jgi:hypothetical protein